MEVPVKRENESRLRDLAMKSGRTPADLIEDALAGYLEELNLLREMLQMKIPCW